MISNPMEVTLNNFLDIRGLFYLTFSKSCVTPQLFYNTSFLPMSIDEEAFFKKLGLNETSTILTSCSIAICFQYICVTRSDKEEKSSPVVINLTVIQKSLFS